VSLTSLRQQSESVCERIFIIRGLNAQTLAARFVMPAAYLSWVCASVAAESLQARSGRHQLVPDLDNVIARRLRYSGSSDRAESGDLISSSVSVM
jgi:hypothetical protein